MILLSVPFRIVLRAPEELGAHLWICFEAFHNFSIFSKKNIFPGFWYFFGRGRFQDPSASLQIHPNSEISRNFQYFFEFGIQKSTKNRKIIKSLDRDVYSSTKMSCIDSEPLGMKTGRDYFAGVKFRVFQLGIADLQRKCMVFHCKSSNFKPKSSNFTNFTPAK